MSNADQKHEQKTAFLVEIAGLNETVLPQSEHEARNRIELGYVESIGSDNLSYSSQIYHHVSFAPIDGGLYDDEDIDEFTEQASVREFMASDSDSSGTDTSDTDNIDVVEGSSNQEDHDSFGDLLRLLEDLEQSVREG